MGKYNGSKFIYQTRILPLSRPPFIPFISYKFTFIYIFKPKVFILMDSPKSFSHQPKIYRYICKNKVLALSRDSLSCWKIMISSSRRSKKKKEKKNQLVFSFYFFLFWGSLYYRMKIRMRMKKVEWCVQSFGKPRYTPADNK